MSVGDWTGTQVAWETELDGVKGRLGRLFRRSETRQAALHYLDGLLAGVEGKNVRLDESPCSTLRRTGFLSMWSMFTVMGVLRSKSSYAKPPRTFTVTLPDARTFASWKRLPNADE